MSVYADPGFESLPLRQFNNLIERIIIMIALIADNREMIEKLCARYKVRRLELFGSAAANSFEPVASDIDFLVEFDSLSPTEHADAFFGFQEELQQILDFPVDLIERAPIRNPYFLQSIDKTKVLLYESYRGS